MILEPYSFSSWGEASFGYTYKDKTRQIDCLHVGADEWADFKRLCRQERYKEAINKIRKYILDQDG